MDLGGEEGGLQFRPLLASWPPLVLCTLSSRSEGFYACVQLNHVVRKHSPAFSKAGLSVSWHRFVKGQYYVQVGL